MLKPEIKISNLQLYGFMDVSVTQMYKGSVSQKQFMPLFMVSMPKINNADDLFNLD